jgi:hypothetical protein
LASEVLTRLTYPIPKPDARGAQRVAHQCGPIFGAIPTIDGADARLSEVTQATSITLRTLDNNNLNSINLALNITAITKRSLATKAPNSYLKNFLNFKPAAYQTPR